MGFQRCHLPAVDLTLKPCLNFLLLGPTVASFPKKHDEVVLMWLKK